MKFGSVPVGEAVGAILAHGVKHGGGMFKKGRRLTADDVAALQNGGIASVVAARLEEDDVPEDEAAQRVSTAVAGSGVRLQQPFTGRANIHANAGGVLVLDEVRLRAINHLHESLTIATLPNFARVEAKQMVATIKVIPFAVPRHVLEQALALLADEPLLRVAPFRPQTAGLILTQLPQTKPNILQKSESVMRERLEAMGSRLGTVVTCAHTSDAVAIHIDAMKQLGHQPILVMGASAIVDRADVIPHAVTLAGGQVVHLGMPVDPGNLLMLGQVGQTPVIGVPSCARSPKVNGFDWVLERLLADVPVAGADIMNMGAGGLLAEIPSRPLPREGKEAVPLAPRVVAIVLAAGLSSRMGGNKLLADFKGQPLLKATLAAIQASSVDEVVLVLGHDAERIDAISHDGKATLIVHNPDYAQGLSTSIRCGVEAAGACDAVLVCLGDMPLVSAQTIDRMIAAFNPTENRSIVVPTHKGEFGNPVLWGRVHFPRLLALVGDKGARRLIAELKAEATEIETDDGVLLDADTPEALAKLRDR